MEVVELRDILLVLWKRKWTVSLVPVLLAALVLLVSMNLTAAYVSSTSIELGESKNDKFIQPETVKELLLSNTTLQPVMEQLQLNYKNVEEFKASIKVDVVDRTRLIKLQVSYFDAPTAQKIATTLSNRFLELSENALAEKRKPLEDLAAQLQKQRDQVEQNITRNKQALTAVETNSALSASERELTRSRLFDYVMMDENQLQSLNSQSQEIQVKMTEFGKASVIESPTLASSPKSPKPTLYALIAGFGGLIFSVFLAFLLEYLSKNPLRTRDMDHQL